jgi:RNA polymerase sigma-70 factor (ECF subfamily)
MKAQPAPDVGLDRDLAEAVLRHGDEAAFRELYRRHTPRLLGFVSRLLAGASPDEDDVVQETWVRACQSLARFEWRSTFSTWLLGIGLNVARDRLRRVGTSRTVPAELAPERSGPGADHEIRIDLERAIRALPDAFRMVLVLHDVEGMKHHEIADRLGVPEGTTKSQLFRARRLIRDMLREPLE